VKVSVPNADTGKIFQILIFEGGSRVVRSCTVDQVEGVGVKLKLPSITEEKPQKGKK